MLVLLPPSEGKATSGRGAPLKLESLSLPGLTAAREAVLDELVDLCAGDEEKAREVLGLSEGLRGEVAKNAELRDGRGAARRGDLHGCAVRRPRPGLPGRCREEACRPLAARLLRTVGRRPGDRPDPLLPLLDGGEAAGARGAGRALADADGGRAARGRRGRAGAGSAVLRVRGRVEAEGRGRRADGDAYGCCTRRPARSSATSTRRPRGGSYGVCWRRARRPRGRPSWWRRCGTSGHVVEAEAPAKAGKAWALDVLVDEIH